MFEHYSFPILNCAVVRKLPLSAVIHIQMFKFTFKYAHLFSSNILTYVCIGICVGR